MGDHVGTARELREAIRIAPSSSDVNELYGRMLLEVGAPERAVAILRAAAALDPAVDLSTGDLLRGRVLAGETGAYEDALLREPADDTSRVHYFLLARLAAWRRDARGAAILREQVVRRRFDLREEVLRMLELVETGKPPEGMQAELARWGRVVGRARRRPMFFRQLAAETRAFIGDEAAALQSLAEADALGLVDVTWADRCPIFEAMRGSPLFIAVRDRIAARAKESLDVLEGRAD